MSVTAINKLIRERRKSLRIRQPSLADIARSSVNPLCRIKKGEANPTIRIVEKVAEVLGPEVKLEVKKIKYD